MIVYDYNYIYTPTIHNIIYYTYYWSISRLDYQRVPDDTFWGSCRTC
jgi:hypothetical protein